MCCDWSERVHYISINNACYVTQVHCQDIMHAAYIISTRMHNSDYILSKKQKNVPRTLMSYYKHLGFFKNT